MTKKLLVCGCSYVAGDGFDLHKDEPLLWVNLLHKNTSLNNHQLINAGRSGRSNSGIFQDAVYHMAREHIDVAIVAWTSMPRYELHLGIEKYDTNIMFLPAGPLYDVNLNDVSYSKKYLESVRDRFLSLINLHYEILNLIHYVNSLINLAKLTNTQLFFVNSLCPWDSQYFEYLTDVLPSSYTDFTKKLLNVDNRDDEEIFLLYNKIHQEYIDAGSIQQQYWLNLYTSLRNLRIDTNNDNLHPGIESNQKYFELLSKSLNI